MSRACRYERQPTMREQLEVRPCDLDTQAGTLERSGSDVDDTMWLPNVIEPPIGIAGPTKYLHRQAHH